MSKLVSNKVSNKKASAKYYLNHKEEIKEKHRKYFQDHKEECYKVNHRYKTTHDLRPYWRLLRRKSKIAAMNQLGGCKCSNLDCLVPGGCTDIRCLQIDHINGNGKKEHNTLGSQGIYDKIVNISKEEARNQYQVLCANCNWIKRSIKGEGCAIQS